MINKMPTWSYPNSAPAFKDTETLTAIRMVAKLYGKTQDLIKDYNEFAENIDKTIEDFESGIIKDSDEFKSEITKIVHDYIIMIDEKIKLQDKKIEELDLIVPDVPNIATTDYVDSKIAEQIGRAIGGEY